MNLRPRLPSLPVPAGMAIAVVLVLGLVATVLPAAGGGAVSAARSTYIVELAAPPLASYEGGIGAFEATSPRATGHPLQMTGSAVRHYRAFLDSRQSRVLAAAGAGHAPVVYRYRTSFPGFAARLTPGEADRLRSTPGVRALTPDGISLPLAARRASSSRGSGLGREGPAFLGLPGGLWRSLGGPEHAGEGVIVGVLDSGIYPDHPSFADRPDPPGGGERRYQVAAYQPPPASKWHGECQAGAGFPATSCNNKLIGARYFVSGYGPENLNQHEFLSPRDALGHGSHTAATAAGNYGVVPTLGGHRVGVPSISGIAPRAWIAMYKVCWAGKTADPKTNEPAQGCTDSDNVAAIDAAVHDGVDVINYSLGAGSAQVFGPVERAFLFAVAAGVFVANAAGNTGPGAGTIGSPGAVPWLASVGATTLGRTFQSPVTVTAAGASGGAPVDAQGASLTDALPSTPLLDAAAVPASGSAPEQAELCLPGSLDAAAVAGKAVLCKRGQNARVEKGKVVRDAGGVGMILYNAKADEEMIADLHWIPAAHVTLETGQAVKALLAGGAGATVKIGGSQPTGKPADVMASFSSRGPQSPVPDIAKPDMTAPGVDILAADTPTPAGAAARPGETFQIISGTSMAAPHVAGVAALLTQLHPTWSPSAIKSALMTTAVPGVTKQDGKTPADPFDTGSGRIDPNRAAGPGLVLDAAMADYLRYLKGRDPSIVPGDMAPLAPVDLNLPTIAFSSFPGVGSTTRTFTSVDTGPSSWRVSVEGLAGITATVTPPSFDVAAGEAQAVTFAFARDGAAFAAYTFGTVVLTDGGGRTLRLPVSIRPVQVAAPVIHDVATGDASGTGPITVGAGYSGDLNALGWGLAPPRTLAGQKVGKAAPFPPATPPVEPAPGVDVFDVRVPPSAQALAAQIANVDGGAPDTDLDLYLFYDAKGDGFDAKDLKAVSAGPGAAESIAIALPPAGAYRFVVTGFKTKDPVSTFDFTTWVTADSSPNDPSTPSTAPGLTVGGNPQRATPGGAATFSLQWSRAGPDGTYLGLVTFHDSTPPDALHPVAATLVRVIKSPPKGG